MVGACITLPGVIYFLSCSAKSTSRLCQTIPELQEHVEKIEFLFLSGHVRILISYTPHNKVVVGGGGVYSPWVYMSVSQGAFSCMSASKWQRHRQIVASFGRHGGGRL